MTPETGTKTRSHSGSGGFSLVEILVVIAVIGIIAGIALPPLMSWRSNLNASQSAKNMVDTLRASRSKAQTTNYQQEVSFDLANGRYEVLNSASRQSYNSTSWDADHPAQGWVQLPGGLTLRSGTGADCDSSANVNVQFNANGTARLEAPWGTRSDTPVIMCVQNGSNVSRRIRIAPSGTITID